MNEPRELYRLGWDLEIIPVQASRCDDAEHTGPHTWWRTGRDTFYGHDNGRFCLIGQVQIFDTRSAAARSALEVACVRLEKAERQLELARVQLAAVEGGG